MAKLVFIANPVVGVTISDPPPGGEFMVTVTEAKAL
jgi:hypothetical protein